MPIKRVVFPRAGQTDRVWLYCHLLTRRYPKEVVAQGALVVVRGDSPPRHSGHEQAFAVDDNLHTCGLVNREAPIGAGCLVPALGIGERDGPGKH